jgi:hypothetical protein
MSDLLKTKDVVEALNISRTTLHYGIKGRDFSGTAEADGRQAGEFLEEIRHSGSNRPGQQNLNKKPCARKEGNGVRVRGKVAATRLILP